MKRDLRKYARQTNVRMTAGAIFLLLVVGVGLIWLIYGNGAGSFAFFCMMSGLSAVLLIVLVFLGVDWILRHARPK